MSLISGLAALAAASTLSAQATPPQERPETLARLMACRGIAENTARLACFDTAAGALDTAERQGDLVVIDRAGVAETRRQLFGFEMPSLPRLFGPEGAVELESIDSTLASASSVAVSHACNAIRMAPSATFADAMSPAANCRPS